MELLKTIIHPVRVDKAVVAENRHIPKTTNVVKGDTSAAEYTRQNRVIAALGTQMHCAADVVVFAVQSAF